MPRVKMLQMLPGENARERVLTAGEESRYLDAAMEQGRQAEASYQKALTGIRATQRGQAPRLPDAFLLRDVATVLFDCGLRADECFRLRWADNILEDGIFIASGKTRQSRRKVPVTQRVRAVLEMRRGNGSEWVFPASTRSGHIEASTIKKQHAAALAASSVEPFVLYTIRHNCLTRWAATMDPYKLSVRAGHSDMSKRSAKTVLL